MHNLHLERCFDGGRQASQTKLRQSSEADEGSDKDELVTFCPHNTVERGQKAPPL